MRGRSMCSRAPQNRITRPCSTTTMLRSTPELEAELGAALVEEAEQQAGDDDADRVVATHQATAMPVKPKPSTKLSLIWRSSPCSTLRAKKPASMPGDHHGQDHHLG